MKNIVKTLGRILGATVLCAISALALIGVLCFYKELMALPFAALCAVTFIGAVAMITHEDGKAAPLADTKTEHTATEQTVAA